MESSSTIDDVREMLRAGKVSLRGSVSPEDGAILTEVDSVVRETAERLDAVFRAMFDGYSGSGFVDILPGIYLKIAKGILRARRKNEDLQVSKEEWDDFMREIHDVVVLFTSHGVSVDALLLKNVMTYGGLQYWKEFFDNREEFASFDRVPGVVRRAIVHSPQDPRVFLRRFKAEIEEILLEDEFDSFLYARWIVVHAVLYSPQDPRDFLRRVKAETKAILAEKEFKGYNSRDVGRAVVQYPKDPRGFLRSSKKKDR